MEEETLYFHILRDLGDPRASEVQYEFIHSHDERHFVMELEKASAEELQSIVKRCVEIVLDDDARPLSWVFDALDILHLITSRASLRPFVTVYREKLKSLFCDPQHIEQWCRHQRGEFIYDHEARVDASFPLSLESLLRRLGPDDLQETRGYIAQHAACRVLRERIVANVAMGV